MVHILAHALGFVKPPLQPVEKSDRMTDVLEIVHVTLTEDVRADRGRLRALEEALDRLREAYWRSLEEGPRDVRITLSLRAERP